MGNVKRIPINFSTSKPVNRSLIESVISQDNITHLHEVAAFNGAVMDIGLRLARFFGPNIMENNGYVTVAECILSHALTAWDATSVTKGTEHAFFAFCESIYDDLPKAFDYSARGKTGSNPRVMSLWDPYSASFYDWITYNRIKQVDVAHKKMKSRFTNRELSMMLSHHVFTRSDLIHWGLPPKGSYRLSRDGCPLLIPHTGA